MLDKKTVQEYNDFLIAHIAFNMLNFISDNDGAKIYQRLSSIEIDSCQLNYTFEVLGDLNGIVVSLGSLPFYAESQEKAAELELEIKENIEGLLEEQGIQTLEKFKQGKAHLTIIK